MESIGIPEIIAGVFAGNMVTVAVVLSLRKLTEFERGEDAPWWALFGVLGPCLYAGVVFYLNLH